MKKILYTLPIFLIFCLLPTQAHAGILNVIAEFVIGLFARSPLDDLSKNIFKLAKLINDSTADMMRFGDMLICSSLHGSAADVDFMGVFSAKIIAPSIFFSGSVLYIIGFLIMVMSSFYLFDAAFNLCIAIVLLPLALALWPFGWTRDKLKSIVDSIVYYTGLFIFLPLGVLIAKQLAFSVVTETFINAGAFNFTEAYNNDQADLIEDNLGFFCLPFLKVFLCYVVAIRIIPLMASDFCRYFFGGALGGTPIMQRLTQMSQSLIKQGKKAGKFGKDIAKHQTGDAIARMGGNSFFGRVMQRYGRNMARTHRWGKAEEDAWKRSHK
ncbi:MAG: hypothetical protein NC218_05735 [Acetobacter sp.]|nr:hypothetical protein [Acetobacter sp.]